MGSIDISIDTAMSGRHLNEINAMNIYHCARSIQQKHIYIVFSIHNQFSIDSLFEYQFIIQYKCLIHCIVSVMHTIQYNNSFQWFMNIMIHNINEHLGQFE